MYTIYSSKSMKHPYWPFNTWVMTYDMLDTHPISIFNKKFTNNKKYMALCGVMGMRENQTQTIVVVNKQFPMAGLHSVPARQKYEKDHPKLFWGWLTDGQVSDRKGREREQEQSS